MFYDHTEARRGTRLPDDAIEYGYVWNGVESNTGADFIVTGELSKFHQVVLMSKKITVVEIAKRLGMTVLEVINMRKSCGDDEIEGALYDYLYTGAIAVQRKSGGDLISSIQSARLGESLARLNKAVPYRSQRVLLYTGVFSEKNGYVVLDGKTTGLKYMSFAMALTAWCNRGGSIINLASDDMILEWVQLLEKQLLEYRHSDEKHVYSETYYPPDMEDVNDVLQVPVEIVDWRKTMITFPKLGPERINSLLSFCNGLFGDGTTLWNAIQMAVSYNTAEKVHGWGKKSVDTNRRWLGIPDGFEPVLQLEITKTKEIDSDC